MKNRRGGVVLAVLLSLLAVAVLGFIVLVAGAVHMARNVHVMESSGKTVVETPVGSVTVRKGKRADPRLLGIPVYPGAVAVENEEGKAATVELEMGDEYHEFGFVAAHYTTADEPARVAEYYRSALPSSCIFTVKRHGWQIRCEQGGYKRIVAVKERDGGSHITLASVGEPASN